MIAEDMVKKLKEYDDFKSSKTIICEIIVSRGHVYIHPKVSLRTIPNREMLVSSQKIYQIICKRQHSTSA